MWKSTETDWMYNDYAAMETENYEDQANIACELADYANRFCSSFDDEWNQNNGNYKQGGNNYGKGNGKNEDQ